MLRLNKKKGFSLVEQLCALSIFSIMSITVISLHLNNIRLRNYNKQIMNYTSVLEAIKQEMLFNYSYDNVKEIYTLNSKFIPGDKLTLSNIRASNLNQLFSPTSDLTNTYLLINITDGEVLKVHMELHIKLKYKEEILQCDFLKGNYL